MLKKNELKRNVIVSEGLALENAMMKYSNVSLRKISTALDISYPALLKASKAPVAGEAYDPDAINYEAVAVELLRREHYTEDIDWETLNAEGRKTSKLVKDADAFKVGDKVYIRREPTTPYTIVYRTATHVVIQLEGTEEPICWSVGTFLLNGPQFEPRAEKVAEEEA